MKIAAITEDGNTISRHFGRAPRYLVVTVEAGLIVHRELRDKLCHEHARNEVREVGQSAPHGFGPIADERHSRMAAAIADCEVLLCGGMGQGAYESFQGCRIRPVVTDVVDIEEAVAAFVNGQIIDHNERVH